MLFKRTIFAPVCVALTAGCSVLGPIGDPDNGRPLTTILEWDADSLDQAVAIGNELSTRYLISAEGAKHQRNRFNIARWVLGTATTVTAGIGVDTETVFLLSAGAQSLAALEQTTNFGGVEAPGASVTATRCVVRAARPAMAPEIRQALANLAQHKSTPSHEAALDAYNALPGRMMDRYVGIYRNYLVATTAPQLELDDTPPKPSVTPPTVSAARPSLSAVDAWASAVSAIAGSVGAAVDEC